MPLTIAVLGATGRLGRAVSLAAVAAGHEVVAVSRSGVAPKGARGIAADARDAEALSEAIRGATVAVNALNPPYPAWVREMPGLTRSVLEACARTGARHLFAGNVYPFGAGMPEVLRPDTSQAPTARKGVLRRDAEALFADAARKGRVRTAILRAGDFYGGTVPGSWFDLAVAKDVARGAVTLPGPRDVPHAWAYLPDLAAAFVALSEREATLPDFASLGFAGHTLTGERMAALVERAAGRPLRRRSLPWGAIRLMGLVHPTSREVAEMRYLWEIPHRIDGTALEKAVGPLPATSPEEAVARALRDLAL